MGKRLAAVTIISLLCGWILHAEEKLDSGFIWKIRQQETEHSKVMSLVHQLTDTYGPRLTGSSNFKAACDWSMGQLNQI